MRFNPGSIRRSSRRLKVLYALLAVLFAGALAGAAAVLQPRIGAHDTGATDGSAQTRYYCPMHPHFKSEEPGNCPVCSMKLVPLESAAPDAANRSMSMEDPGSASTAAGGGAPTVQISPERQQQIGVRFAPAVRAPASVEIRAVGRVAFDETKVTHVHSKVSGWIEEVFVDYVGAPVRKGQPLFSIYSPDLVASQQEYLLALRARKELGESSFEHVAEGSRSLVESARRRLELWDMSPAQVRALEKRGEISRTVTVASPSSGVVTERAAYHHGRYVTPELDLYTIVPIDRVWVLADVYEYELGHVSVGQPAQATLPYAPERAPLEGKVTFVHPFLDPRTRTVQVRMEFPNPDLSLKPETFVNVTLRRDLGSRLAVPRSAVMDTGELQYVFVDRGKGYLEPRKVKAGAEIADDRRVVLEGLDEGERVVTAANFIVDSESRLKGAFDAMTRPPGREAPAAGAASSLRADIETEPSPAKVGENTVRVRVSDASGTPVVGAEVEMRLFMPQMGSMPPMEAKAQLREEGTGVYVGRIDVPMAWTWETTIRARREGQELGAVTTTITAR